MLENEVLAFGETEGDFSAGGQGARGRGAEPRAARRHADVRAEDLRPYECDGLAAYRALPLVVALPSTEEQVVAVLRICLQMGVPVVARGAGTGLSGGALPHTRGVLLSLARFNRILELDPLARTARRAARRAQPGDLRGRGAPRPVLRARPVLADRLLDRRQRRRERRRRALPQVRPDGAQPAARARRHHRGRDRRDRLGRARRRRATTCWRW